MKDQSDLDQVLVLLDQDSNTKGLHIRLLRDPLQIPKSPVHVIISRSPPCLQAPPISSTPRSPLPTRNARSPLPIHLSPFQDNLLVCRLFLSSAGLEILLDPIYVINEKYEQKWPKANREERVMMTLANDHVCTVCVVEWPLLEAKNSCVWLILFIHSKTMPS